MSATPSPSNPDAKSNRTINPPEIVIVKNSQRSYTNKNACEQDNKKAFCSKKIFYAKQLELRLNP